MTSLHTPPTRIYAADDLLELARSLIDADGAAIEADPDNDVSCTAGCSACCSQAVPVTPAEVRSIRAAIAELDLPLLSTIEQRIVDTALRLRAEGVTEVEPGMDRDARRRRADAYFALDVPCPLLENGTCSVRAARPVICREYLVANEPAECARLGQGGVIVRIRTSRDVVAGFAEVSAITGEPHHVTLALALAESDPPPPATRAYSGVAMASRLLSHTVTGDEATRSERR